MKKKTSLMISLTLLVCLLLSGCSHQSVLNEVKEYEADTWYADENSGFANLATEDEKAVYVILKKAIFNHSEDSQNISFYRINKEQLERIWAAINQDHPEIFWLESFEYVYSEDERIEQVRVLYQVTLEEREAMQAEIDIGVSEYLSLLTVEMNDYTKIKTLHDAIISTTRYVPGARDNQNIYSVFGPHESVCAGYSKAFQYLLKQEGIYCTIVNGTNLSENSLHCWNIVKIDGSYYQFDITSDDGDYADALNGENLRHSFFAITSDEMARYSVADTTTIQYAECTNTTYNYYQYEGLYFQNAQEMYAKMDQVIANHGTTFEAKFPDSATLELALQGLQDQYGGRSMKVYYSMTDKIPTITFFITYL